MVKRCVQVLMFILLVSLMAAGCAEEERPEQGFTLFTEDETLLTQVLPEEEAFQSLADDHLHKGVTLIGRQGEMIRVDGPIILRTKIKGIEVRSDNQVLSEDLVALYSGKELPGVGTLYHEATAALDQGVPVLAFLLDGFSHAQYQKLSDEGRVPFLDRLYLGKAISVYTPVTNAGFASIITGALPPENGVHHRDHRALEVPSLFGYAVEKKQSALLLEGEIQILNTEIDPLLHVDLNGDGETDDEIFETALEAVSQEQDLVFIHFHGIDDRGHAFGPYDERTLSYIEVIEEYMRILADDWEGVVLATSDHGMIERKEGGDHGAGQYEDMIVPYFKRGQGK